jgi:hypothetical protein
MRKKNKKKEYIGYGINKMRKKNKKKEYKTTDLDLGKYSYKITSYK